MLDRVTTHGDDGWLELVGATQVAPSQVTYVVRLTYADDGDVIPAAAVTITVGDTESAMTPTGDGHYTATVDIPGDDPTLVVFRSLDPPAVLEHRELLADAPSTTAVTVYATARPTSEVTPDGGGGSGILLVLMVVFATAMVVVAALYARSRRPTR